MTQQGPPSPGPGWTPGGRSRRPPWQDDDPDDEDYAAWVGQSILPRYADQEERDRRRLGGPRAPADGAAEGRPDGGRLGRHGRTPEQGRPASEGRWEGQSWEGRGADTGPATDPGNVPGRRRAQSGRAPVGRPPAEADSGHAGWAPDAGWPSDGPPADPRGADPRGVGDRGRDGDSRWAEEARRARDARREDDSGRPADAAASAGPRRARGGGQEGGGGPFDDGWDGPAGSFGPRRTRSAAGRIRRGRRAIWSRAVALVVLIAVGAAAWVYFTRKPAPKPVSGGLVTSFLPGEFKSVPNACSSLSAATLDSYVPGNRHILAPRSLFGQLASTCSWSVDAPPLYRLLQTNLRAYAPNGLAKGDGSATEAAIGAYQQAQASKEHPPKGQRPARVSLLPGLGQAAFSAAQRPAAEGATTDMVTVVARERNVLVTVVYEGLTTANGKYGPVSMAKIRVGAETVAREVLARLG